MFKRFLRKILSKPLTRFANRISSAPVKKDVFESLGIVLSEIRKGNTTEGIVLPYEMNTGRFIIFSDQHKGARDAADDFAMAEKNYCTALNYYFDNQYSFINLGDCEELWENTPEAVMKANKSVLETESKFLGAKRYYRVFGNHDLVWKFPLQQKVYLRPVFGDDLVVYEGLELKTSYKDKSYSIFVAHGHQGDKRSDGNAFSTWVVATIWTPLQRFLNININTVAKSFDLVDAHNIIMYEWSTTQEQLIFISGHTHKPVFASLDHIDQLTHQLQAAKLANDTVAIEQTEAELTAYAKEYEGKKFVKSMARPSYFNSGCCCFDDGDISGIEIADGNIRLIKWKTAADGSSQRMVWQEATLAYIFEQL